jgi:hypothetical protein
MSEIWKVLFAHATRRLRRLGLFGVLIGLALIVYVEIPVETAAIQSELQSIGRTVVHNIHENQQKAQGRERRERHAAR